MAEPSDDSDLVRRVRAGDEAACEALFRRHYAALVGYARRYLGTTAAAEDLVQEIFLRLWARRERLDPARSIRGYLYRVARNRALNELRHGRVVRAAEAQLRQTTPAAIEPKTGQPGEGELAAAIQSAVEALPERCREVFRLSREHGMTYREIADALEISIKTVETQMGRALRSLRESLTGYLP